MTKGVKKPAPKKSAAKKAPEKAGGKLSVEARHKVFVEAYIANGGVASEAAITAGYSAKTAHQMGYKTLNHPAVKEMLRARQGELQKRYELTTDSVIAELAKIVHADPRKLFNEDGSMKAPQEWSDEMAGVIASVEVYEEFDDVEVEEDREPQAHGGALKRQAKQRKLIGYTKKLKLWDKNSAIEKAMKHLGMFERDNTQKQPVMFNLNLRGN